MAFFFLSTEIQMNEIDFVETADEEEKKIA